MSLSSPMKRACVIGNPIAHSLSPTLFSFIAQFASQRDFDYTAEKVLDTGLESFVEKAKKSLCGFNITSPYKQTIMPLLNFISDEAKLVGAVNAVKIENAKTYGFNTDVLGILDSISSRDIEVSQKNVLILGAGGAARAAAFACATLKAKRIVIIGRTLAKANEITSPFAERFTSTHFLATEVLPSNSVFILTVNATPLGMKGFTDSGEEYFSQYFLKLRPHANIEKKPWAFDMIYNPEHTSFRRQAETSGFNTFGGLEMLISQALGTWEIWMGKLNNKPELKEQMMIFLRDHLRQQIK